MSGIETYKINKIKSWVLRRYIKEINLQPD